MRILFTVLSLVLFSCNTGEERKDEKIGLIENGVIEGIHEDTGLIAEEGYRLVIANCTPCHSSKLITQNRATREGWENMIRWMQKKQNLWDLGEAEDEILDYLATNYAPDKKGRRENLKNIDWYRLED